MKTDRIGASFWGRSIVMLVVVLLTLGIAQSVQATPLGQRLRDLAAQRGRLIGAAAGWRFFVDQTQKDLLKAEFNVVTPENDMKWYCLHPSPNEYKWTWPAPNDQDPRTYLCSSADEYIAFAEANHMQVHGHVLVWHEWPTDEQGHEYSWLPNWIKNISATSLESVMRDHINTVVGHYRGRIQLWDVVNEAIDCNPNCGYRQSFWNNPNAMGTAYIPKAFIYAHNADSNATLIYNDYGIETINPKSNFLYQEIKNWRKAGAPINAIGIQAHIGVDFKDFQGFAKNMQRFANDLGLDIYITELDVQMNNSTQYQQQAEVYRNIVQTCLAQARCKGITTWGFTDKYTWLNYVPWGGPLSNPLPFNECFQPKPAYYAMQEALGGSHGPTFMLQAEAYNQQQGVSGDTHNDFIYNVHAGSWLRFNNVNLGNGFTTLKTCYAKGVDSNTTVQVRLDSLTGSIIAQFNTTNTGGWNNFAELPVTITGGTGVHTLYIGFNGNSDVGNFDDFLFEGTQAPPPGPFTLQAEKYDAQQGVETYATFIGFVDNGDWIKFNNVNLGNGFKQLRLGYAKGNKTKTRIEVHAGSLTGPKIAELTTTSTGGWNTFKEKTTTIKSGTGLQTLYFLFAGGDGVGNIDYFTFEKPHATASDVNSAAASEADNSVDETPEDADSSDTSSYLIYLPAISR